MPQVLSDNVKQVLKRLPMVHDVQRRLDARALKTERLGEDPASRATSRWRTSQPDERLTWGMPVSGAAFVRAANGYGAFEPDRAVLEIGPGYGRLVEAALQEGLPFRRWLGVDLSEDTVSRFNARFADQPVHAVAGDVASLALGEQFGTMLSSLTFKHLYPTFERALDTITRHLEPGGLAIFDLMEGDRRFFERHDHRTYIRQYTRAEATALVGKAGLEMVALDTVEHDSDPRHHRLLVVARKPA
jgi:SAM-dependent methyltransferase